MNLLKLFIIPLFFVFINAWFHGHANSFYLKISPVSADIQGVEDVIEEKSKQIQELERQIQELARQAEQKRKETRTLENEVGRLDSQIRIIELEVRRTQITINQVNGEIAETSKKIQEAEETIGKHRLALAQAIRILSQNDNKSLTEIIFKYDSLSDFFSNLYNIQTTQDSLKVSIQNIKVLKTGLEETKEELRSKKLELDRYKLIQEIDKRSVNNIKKEKNNLLKDTRGKESQFQKLIQQSKFDIERIREQVFFLQQNGISVEDAVKFGQLAALRVGIRPAFLLAILEIESGLGKNVGKGNWLDDMYECYLRLRKPERAETEKASFFAIISKLGLDPNSVKVSKEPNYGCGGALGPAQFIPSTWLAYEEEVARLTGHNPPNPWSIEDAFMASAIKLARGGADGKTIPGEDKAARIYISGRGSCRSRICNYYANAVKRKAEQIEKNL